MDYKVYKGHYYYCIKSVIMQPTGEEAYTKGKVYFSENNDELTDNQRDPNHVIDRDFAERFFVPVDAVVKAYTEGVMRKCNREAV